MKGTKSPSSYVYLIECLGPDKFYKIGYAANPQQRLKELQTGCPYELQIVLEFPGGFCKEQEIHEFHKNSLLRGEWYNLSSIAVTVLQMKALAEWAPYADYLFELALNEGNPQQAVQKLYDCFQSCEKVAKDVMGRLEPMMVGEGP